MGKRIKLFTYKYSDWDGNNTYRLIRSDGKGVWANCKRVRELRRQGRMIDETLGTLFPKKEEAAHAG